MCEARIIDDVPPENFQRSFLNDTVGTLLVGGLFALAVVVAVTEDLFQVIFGGEKRR